MTNTITKITFNGDDYIVWWWLPSGWQPWQMIMMTSNWAKWFDVASPTSISLDESSIELNFTWDTQQLTATVSPSTAIVTQVDWSSSNTSVATVSSSWLVTCVTPWNCTITASTVNGLTATCGVTRGGWWQPWANTLAYYPLNSTTTTSDMKWSWTAYNLSTLRSWVSYWTYNWVDCANFSWWWWKLQAAINIQQVFTLSWWFYITQSWNYQSLMLVWGGSTSQRCLWSWYRRTTSYLALTTWGNPEVTGGQQISWRHHICITRSNIDDSNDAILYLDWVHYLNMNTSELTLAGDYLTIWWHPWNLAQDPFYWCASEIIYEDVVWTSTEVSNYFNQTKANYWIS